MFSLGQHPGWLSALLDQALPFLAISPIRHPGDKEPAEQGGRSFQLIVSIELSSPRFTGNPGGTSWEMTVNEQ